MNRRAALFLFLYVAGILYLSLYPWTFVPDPGPKTLPWFPLVSRRAILDAVLNVVFYVPLGAAAFLSLLPGVAAFPAALAFGTLVSFGVEYAQHFIPNRTSSLNDLLCNSLGTLLGILVVMVGSRVRVRISPSVLLVGLWAVWQAFTFLPRYGPAIDMSHEIVGLLILALLVVRRQFQLSAALLLIWLAVDELRPFRFHGPRQAFWWLPFESWFEGAFESYYGTFFGKVFFYTSVLWVERRAGVRWIWALLAPGAVLFAGELAQCYLPGRTPEITDVVLLAAGAVMLRMVEQ